MSDILQLRDNFHITNASEKDGDLYIEGYAAHYDRANLNKEVVNASSFDYFFSLYNEGKLKPCLSYEHDNTQIIGAIDSLESKEDGLYMSAHLTHTVPLCQTLIPNILAGNINSFSSEGFVVGGVDGIEYLDNDEYFVKNFLLTAVSVVNTPADWDATFTVKNYLDVNGLNPKTSNALTDKEKGDKSAVLLLL